MVFQFERCTHNLNYVLLSLRWTCGSCDWEYVVMFQCVLLKLFTVHSEAWFTVRYRCDSEAWFTVRYRCDSEAWFTVEVQV